MTIVQVMWQIADDMNTTDLDDWWSDQIKYNFEPNTQTLSWSQYHQESQCDMTIIQHISMWNVYYSAYF